MSRKTGEHRLIDQFGRRIEYLRLSVTDRCDLRCAYCMPADFADYQDPAHWLSFEEIRRVLSVLAGCGLSRVRITGGEPLLRNRIVQLAASIKRIEGIRDLSLSTNGTQLGKHAGALRRAGVDRINVSLDTLRPERFARITRRDALQQVFSGLDAASAAGFAAIKVNMVWMPGTNDDEIEDMIGYCRDRGYILRLIENMPMGDSGREAGHSSLQPMIAGIQKRYGLIDGVIPGGGPARYLVSPDQDFSIGFITPLSQHFCASCNRIRMTVDGTLQLCLGQEDRLELRPLLRGGASDNDIEAAIMAAIRRKPERHEFLEAPQKLLRFMSMTGG